METVLTVTQFNLSGRTSEEATRGSGDIQGIVGDIGSSDSTNSTGDSRSSDVTSCSCGPPVRPCTRVVHAEGVGTSVDICNNTVTWGHGRTSDCFAVGPSTTVHGNTGSSGVNGSNSVTGCLYVTNTEVIQVGIVCQGEYALGVLCCVNYLRCSTKVDGLNDRVCRLGVDGITCRHAIAKHD